MCYSRLHFVQRISLLVLSSIKLFVIVLVVVFCQTSRKRTSRSEVFKVVNESHFDYAFPKNGI